jgi:hydrogenase-4 component B
MAILLIVSAMVLSGLSGFPGLFLSRTTIRGQQIASFGMCLSALIGIAGSIIALDSSKIHTLLFPWPSLGNSIIGIDALSAFFMIPVYLMGAVGSIYGLKYWKQSDHPENGRKLILFWGLLVTGMALLLVSRHAIAFLLGWELMALSAFFLVSTEDHLEECRWAGWIYLIATHAGTLALFILFSLWRKETGSYLFVPADMQSMNYLMIHLFFFLGLFGFGLKAGIIPLHFWLPGAHASSPTHVSAMLSGVVLKMGIYGLVRWLSLFPSPPHSWGSIILLLGAVSGILGVVFALAQHDLKRLLAYHSVENIGIILMGLGLALLGQSSNRPEWIVLGMAGCLLHVWNHSFFKSLLFLSAGSVIHATHTRKIDELGGLQKLMPHTATMFLIGAVAICGLPPLNGFISELFIYTGMFKVLITNSAGGAFVALVIPVLGMIGALAGACFIKVYGTVFLGSARVNFPFSVRESSVQMLIPMVILAALCILIGVAPIILSGTIDNVVATWSSSVNLQKLTLASMIPFKHLSILALILAVCIAAGTFIILRLKRNDNKVAGTWDCGYASPDNRMQYSASSFANSIIDLFRWILHPRVHRPQVGGIFPERTKMKTHVDEFVLDRSVIPISKKIGNWFEWFHRFQQGLIQHYILYILIALLIMLGMQIPLKEIIVNWFAH